MRNYWSLKLSSLLGLLYWLPLAAAFAQLSRPDFPELKKEDNETYLYPINPGTPGSLAGNMGELRSNHFHSGIDIRTNNVIGVPVLASKSGYISRATMSPSGYGNVLYLKHPDGNTTLYAHLDKFSGEVARYILNEQYVRKTSDIDLYFHENQFIVNQGDTIALSGNTGSSAGPHLHFDIRDAYGNALDPLSFGFNEIIDNVSPKAEKIALVTLDKYSRVNDRFGRFEFYVLKGTENFHLSHPILVSGNIGIELLAKDRLAYKSPYFGGVKSIQVLANDRVVFHQKIDQINLSETRKINTVLNFKAFRTNGSKFYKLYLDDGNDLAIVDRKLHGKLRIESELTKVEIRLTDVSNNSSSLLLSLKKSEPTIQTTLLEPLRENLVVDYSENILKVAAKGCTDKKAVVFQKNQSVEKSVDYYNVYQSNYLIDLRELLPDSVVTCSGTYISHIKAIVPSGIVYTYYGPWADVTFEKDALYDTLYLAAQKRTTKDSLITYRIGDPLTPLHKSISVSLRNEHSRWGSRSAVYRLVGKGFAYIGGDLNNDRINFSTRELGEFTILADTLPPTVRPIYLNAQSVRFKIRDDLSGIKSFQATVNGQWLLMHYDAKTGVLMSEKKNKTEPLKGDLVLEVTDMAGNKEVFKSKIL